MFTQVERFPYGDKMDFLAEECKTTMHAYKKGSREYPPNHDADMKWSLDLLELVFVGRPINQTLTIRGGLFGEKTTHEVKPDLS